jgi:hypothetical protein
MRNTACILYARTEYADSATKLEIWGVYESIIFYLKKLFISTRTYFEAMFAFLKIYFCCYTQMFIYFRTICHVTYSLLSNITGP